MTLHIQSMKTIHNLSETQARAILELRLQRLTNWRKRSYEELQTLSKKIKEYLAILGSREQIMSIIMTELNEVKEQFVPRRTEIVEWSGDMEDEDLIEREDMVVTVTSGGYIKEHHSSISELSDAAEKA